MNNRLGDGPSITLTAAAAIQSGDLVVMGSAGVVTVGVAAGDAAIGEQVEVFIEGEFSLPAVTGAAFEAGESVDFDSSAGLVDDNAMTAAAGDVSDFGIAMETIASAGAGSSVKVKLTPGRGTIT